MLTKPRTKTVITMGPACADPAVFARLVHEGVSVVRLNFSHGDLVQRQAFLQTARSAVDAPPMAILGDVCGPKIRLGKVVEG